MSHADGIGGYDDYTKRGLRVSICCMKELLEDAGKQNKAVGSFSVGNMEMVIGAVKAAEELNTPIILQIAQVRLKHSPLYLMAPMMLSAAKQAKVDVAVHFDHGLTLDGIREALNFGFTSVMFDGSKHLFDENVRLTREVMQMAAVTGACVEAELGVIGKNEDGSGNGEAVYTDPEVAERFGKMTGVSALAVAIGNSHGHYSQEPHLRFDILEEINQLTDIPLVLHGGTGISADDFRKCIACGIRKINIATANFDALTGYAGVYFMQGGSYNYFSLNEAMVEGVYNNIKRHILIFNNRDEIS